VIATVLSLVNKVFDVLPELLIGVAVDVVVNEGDSLMSRITGVEDRFEQLLILAGVTIVIWLCESASDFAAHVMWRNLAQSIEHDTRMEVYGHVQTLEMSYFEDTTSGGMMTVLNDDVNQLERFLDTGADDIIQSVANVVLVGLVFAIISPTLMVLAFLPIPIIVVGSLLYQKRLEPRYDAVRSSAADIGDTLSNSLGGVATVKAFSGEAREVARLEVESRRYAQVNGEAIRLSSAFIPIIRIAILAGFVMTLVVGGKAALDGTLAVGMYSVLVFMTQRLLWPLTELGQILDLYQRAMASCRRIFGLLELQPTIAPGTHELKLPVRGDVRFDAVEFSYHRPDPSDSVGVAEGADAAARASVDRRVLRDFSLHAPAGETHAIVGSTGSGKSTVLKLLLRLYEPDAGTISLDGVPTDSLTFASLRGATGLVPQDVFLFHGTVAENIAYGRPDAPASRSSLRPSSPKPTRSSLRCPTATTRWWASAARSSRAVNGSASRSLARSCGTLPCCCSTRRPPPSTTRPRPRSRRRWRGCHWTAPPSSSRTVCRRSVTPTASTSWRPGASSKRVITTS